MALISPLNQNLHPKPLPPIINPSTRRNSSKFSIVDQRNQPSLLSSSIQFHTRFHSRRRNFPIVNELGKNSDQSRRQGDGDEDIGVKAALSILRFYKREISPLLPNSCRYVPTCSEYSMIAYKKYGVVKGSILTAWRLCRCNPLGGSGFDPPRWFDEKSINEFQEMEEEQDEEEG